MSPQLRSRDFLGATIGGGTLARFGSIRPLFAASDPLGVLHIGTRKQLLVDDVVVAGTKALKRVLHPASKADDNQPVQFWRAGDQARRSPMLASLYASPLYDAQRGVFRMSRRIRQIGQQSTNGKSIAKDRKNTAAARSTR